jgi:hypothetical protein
VFYHLVQLFAYIAVAGASMLIMLRTYVFPWVAAEKQLNAWLLLSRIAIWSRDKVVTLITTCIWCTNVAFLVHSKSDLPISGSSNLMRM